MLATIAGIHTPSLDHSNISFLRGHNAMPSSSNTSGQIHAWSRNRTAPVAIVLSSLASSSRTALPSTSAATLTAPRHASASIPEAVQRSQVHSKQKRSRRAIRLAEVGSEQSTYAIVTCEAIG